MAFHCSRRPGEGLYTMDRHEHLVLKGILGSAAALALANVAAAETLYDSRGFEAPAFTLGQLEGQDPVSGPWFSDSVTSTGVVQNTVARSGSQSVQIDRAPGDDSRWL